MNLVRYECGCIGWPPDKVGYAVILRPHCIRHGHANFDLCYQLIPADTPYNPLDVAYTGMIMDQANALWRDGEVLRQIKELLK